ncbi:hypothetical protein AB1Y20_014285 [Prymnesium parvum]|uniref:Protein xylosyltransferase n=1 Tax=Prymnesium parvum TaxID=97485 RepID=A0AB34IDL0_PRYPA
MNCSTAGFDVEADAACAPSAASSLRLVPTAAACARLCAAAAEGCHAAHFSAEGGQCVLHRVCLHRLPAPPSLLFHRKGPHYPVPPEAVRWRTNASLVVAHYNHSLRWLQSLPRGLLDVVIYHKHDFGLAEAPRLHGAQIDAMLRERICCGHSLLEPPDAWPAAPCPLGCSCTRSASLHTDLAFFTTLPNYGVTSHKPRGGSREPFVYLQFIIDFWHNLPPVVIFAQDDCLSRACGWAHNMPHLEASLRAWPRLWGTARPMRRENCFCHLVTEHNYQARKYYWFPLMSFLQSRLLNVSLANLSKTVHWVMDANMVVSRAAIRSNSKAFYVTLRRLTTVERRCLGAASIEWAHAYERLWTSFFNPDVHKELKFHLPHASCLATPARAASACHQDSTPPAPSPQRQFSWPEDQPAAEDALEDFSWPPTASSSFLFDLPSGLGAAALVAFLCTLLASLIWLVMSLGLW